MLPSAPCPWPFLVLMAFELLGEMLQAAFHLPVPGAVLGMFLLAPVLIAAEKSAMSMVGAASDALKQLSHFLLSWMGLFFVPAGAGLLAERDLLAREWFPILAAVTGSTIVSISTTGLVMHFFLRSRSVHADRQPERARL
jgi:holin-like protein